MSQSQLVVDFPIKAPDNAKAVAEELPPLMADFAACRTISVRCISPGSWSETRSFSSCRTLTARPTSISTGSWRVPTTCLMPSSDTWTILQHARGG